MKNSRLILLWLIIVALIVGVSSFITPPPATNNELHEGDSIYVADPEDTLWNVVIYVEFAVDANGTIHDVLAEKKFECMKCDSSMIDTLKAQAVSTVEKIGVWENLQHKDIRYEYPIHMIKLHKDVHHEVYHHEDSLKKDID